MMVHKSLAAKTSLSFQDILRLCSCEKEHCLFSRATLKSEPNFVFVIRHYLSFSEQSSDILYHCLCKLLSALSKSSCVVSNT